MQEKMGVLFISCLTWYRSISHNGSLSFHKPILITLAALAASVCALEAGGIESAQTARSKTSKKKRKTVAHSVKPASAVVKNVAPAVAAKGVGAAADVSAEPVVT